MEEGLERFIEAQDSYGTYETALQEMKGGQKRSHWIWYIFPQLKGFGRSYNSQYYGIDDVEEAKDYLEHPVLGKRLREITSALLTHADEDAVTLMGSHIDAIKLRSSMTLFDAIAPNDVFAQVLGAFFDGRRDKKTLEEIYMNDREIAYDRFKGCIYGQAIGDALGLGTEGMIDEDMAWKYPHGLQHYSQIFQDRHRKRWKIGDWTDDTDMMLCIAHAVIEDKGVNFTNIANHFKKWAMGEPMGIGENTYKVLNIGDYVDKPFDVSKLVWEMSHKQSAANGGLMRTSVVGLFPKAVKTCAENICKLTHYDPRCVGSCVIVSELIHALVYDEPKSRYQNMVAMADEYDERIADYIYLAQNSDDIVKLMDDNHMGYTLVTLSVALWAYWHAKSFEDGLLAVVNAGGDADTNAAVACAILGAKYGFSTIPQEYVDGLIYKEQLDEVVDGLAKICIK